MDALDIARTYASHIAEQERLAHKQALESPRTNMNHWIARLLDCKTLQDFHALLTAFSGMNCWTLEQKASMSKHYTPKVMKLCAQLDDGEKWKWLYEFEALCFKPGR